MTPDDYRTGLALAIIGGAWLLAWALVHWRNRRARRRFITVTRPPMDAHEFPPDDYEPPRDLHECGDDDWAEDFTAQMVEGHMDWMAKRLRFIDGIGNYSRPDLTDDRIDLVRAQQMDAADEVELCAGFHAWVQGVTAEDFGRPL